MNFPAFAGLFPQEEAVKLRPVLNLSGGSDIDGLRRQLS